MFRKRRLPVTRRIKRPPRRAESAANRKRNRMILKSVLVGVGGIDAVLVLLLLYLVFLHMPYFNLQQVDVTGNHHLSREEVIEASELEQGMNLLTVNLGRIAEQLKRHPWIRSASVYRRFPGRILIEIRERTPRAILAAGKLYYVDEQAEFFTRLFPGDPVHYPLFTGVKPRELASHGPEVRELMRKGLSLLDLLERRGSGLNRALISEVRINIDEGLTLFTTSGRAVVLGKNNFDRKIERYRRLKRFLTQRGEWNNARIIDLDFEDRALVRSGGARLQG
jgi:cell division protein FtsQ